MGRLSPWIANLGLRFEQAVFGSGWTFKLGRALGLNPTVKVAHHDIHVAAAEGLPPLRMAYASDFHVGPLTDPALLRAACSALRDAEADVLLLGGDFVTLKPGDVDWLAAELGTIPAPLGRFAVLGNHDWWSDGRYISARLESAGIQVLTNRNVRLPAPFDRVWICGLDDHWYGRPDGFATIAGAEGIRVLLMHAPSGLLDLDGQRFDLALCGHTHGGQIALPGGTPIIVPGGGLSRRYARGRFELGPEKTLLVSVGLGCVVLPLRLFAEPEIMVCTLRPAATPPSPSHSLHSAANVSSNLECTRNGEVS
jgi:uncharacterized protein